MANAIIRYNGGLQFVGEADSRHAVVMDGEEKFGGRDSGARPMELLLMGIGGCSGMDVVSILKKKTERVTGLEINVDGKIAEDYPHKYTDINIEYVVRGKGLSEEAVKRAIQLSMDKYCSVKATLEGSAKITFSYKIVEE
ncbi:Protein YhfA [Candidatus Sulfobium mesophilum]|uniref:Protein YhfA n=1 Tax=Candidatus Sulfobium mesophilum TaxID=2016548 RepID=A0A2U3QJ95_9BACT|nr:Protein YhfA [Candidatus Sulfobium mesophilum]